MKENAIIVRPLDIIKVYVDFSNLDNVYKAIDANRVSTIHTAKTQEISAKLGIHLMGFVNREGDDINNKKACEISGYDYLGSNMLLCKTDDRFNALPFEEQELECVYTYLTEGKIIASKPTDGAQEFIKMYGVNPPLVNCSIEPTFYWVREVPYVLLVRYDLESASDEQLEEFGRGLFELSTNLLVNFTDGFGETRRHNSGRYYIKCFMEPSRFYNFLVQVMEDGDDEDKLIIVNAEDMIYKGYVNRVDEKLETREEMDDTLEEVLEQDVD